MDYKAIQELIKSLDESKLTYLEVESEGIHLTLKKETEKIVSIKDTAAVDMTASNKVQLMQIEKTENQEELPKAEVKQEEENGVIVTSPIVGTVYLAPSPERPDFVEIGSEVKKGDTLCIIEAMKLMNEIESEADGTVVDIYVSNEQMIEYGQPLFKISQK